MNPSPVNQSTTQSTSASATGITGAAAVVLIWILTMFKISVPSDVAVAISALIAPIVHYVLVRMTMLTTPPGAAVAPATTPGDTL